MCTFWFKLINYTNWTNEYPHTSWLPKWTTALIKSSLLYSINKVVIFTAFIHHVRMVNVCNMWDSKHTNLWCFILAALTNYDGQNKLWYSKTILNDLIAHQEARLTGYVLVISRMEWTMGILHILHGIKGRPWLSLTQN